MPEQKKAVVPRLRFPEFRDAGPWEYRKLERHLEPYNERVPASGCNLPIYTSSRDGLISQKDYFDGRELINEGEYGVVPPGYFVYRHMSDDATFKFNLNNTGGSIAVSKEYPVFTTHAVVDLFLLFLLNEGEHFKRFAATQRKGGTRTRLYFATLCSCSLPMPSIPEQQKIADCLSSLDELIELEAKKLEALQAHKKGLMQQLFPREGETTPRLRFPEFRDAGPWEVKRLGEIVEIINERAGDKKCTLLSVTAGIGLVSQVEKFGREIAGKQRRNYFILRKNDFAYNKSATKDYPEGYIGLYEGDEIAAVPNSIFVCFRPAQEKVVPRYLRFLFEINVHGRWMRRFITVGARAHGSLNIDNHNLLHIPIPLPATAVSIPEQQKIADCLSSLDELIELQAKQLEALQTHKKGLMQQLFPQEIDL